MTLRRPFRRWALSALAVGAIATGGGALAWACTPDAYINLNAADAGPPGSSLTILGHEWNPGATVSLSFSGRSLGTATADSSGSISASATVPNVAPGRYYVTAFSSDGFSAPAAPYVVTGAGGGPAPGGDGNPATDEGAGGGSGSSNSTSGSSGSVGGPGSASGSASGGSASADGRTSAGVSGGNGARVGDREGLADSGLATTGSGDAVFADSLAAGEAARNGSPAGRDPSARTASADLWSGFASGDGAARAGLGEAAGPADGPGSALTVSLALGAIGLMVLIAGGAATALRRRRALARRSTD